MSNNIDEQMITLKSFDGEEFIVKETVAKMSKTISNMIEDGYTEGSIPLPNVIAKILTKVIEYCEKHVVEQEGSACDTASHGSATLLKKEIENWDKEFVNVNQEMVFDLIMAANYLNIQGLLDLTCKTVADQMANKSPEEIRKIFHIKNNYTPEEEAEVRREHQWAFD